MTISNAMFNYIAARDHRVMKHVNNWRAPRWIRMWMIAATRLGDGWLWYSIGLIVLLFGGAERYEALGAAAVSSATGVILFVTLKRLFNRQRPSAIDPHCWATLLPPDRFSFPSGHTITAFSIAVPLGLFYPAILMGLLFCALSIALSRVLLGLHFLSDVLAGCVIGVTVGLISASVI